MKLAKAVIFIWLLTLSIPILAATPDNATLSTTPTTTLSFDNATFIDANQILMFVTNFGSFGKDFSGVFGHDYGTWWPYDGDTSIISANIDGVADLSPLYAAGLWMGGIDSATGETRVVICDYFGEYVPGPMQGGTFMPDEPAFRNYKLYMDSLETNPNADYLNWPVDQGAPLDDMGNPYMLGRQMLWSVYNDANPDAHTNDAGSTAPLGVEVQQTVWAGDDLGEDTIYYNNVFEVTQTGTSEVEVTAWAVDLEALTGDDYRVIFEDTILADTTLDPIEGTIIDTLYYWAWHLENITTDQRLLEWQYPDSVSEVVDGFKVRVTSNPKAITSFEVVANASGPLPSPVPGAMASMGFPTPGDVDPGTDQQVGDAIWMFHTADNGGTSGGGTRASYEDFLLRVLRNDNADRLGYDDYEMRFTGSYDNPGVNGSYVIEWYNDDNVFWVPFELWRTGTGTPEDPGDDVRLIIFAIDDYGDVWVGNDAYGLESWGSDADGTCSGDCEHSVSDGDDDPFTDWIYWIEPVDDSPGEAGYLAAEADMLAGTFADNFDDHYGGEIMARTVLVGLNAGKEPTFAMDYPEQGTVFRITTTKPFTPSDTFTFSGATPPYYVTSLEGSSVYVKYKLYNKGYNVIKDMYFALWSDPDIGGSSDDLAGCDTLNDIFFCYNGDNDDDTYGVAPPALGFKYLYGPVVPSEGNTAFFDGQQLPDYTNLGLTAFMAYCCPGIDPEISAEVYAAFQGRNRLGELCEYEGKEIPYWYSGDPVTGTGDVDSWPAQRRMLGSSGPFDFRPGDSQFVLIKMAVAQGTDNLNSITEVKAILNEPFDPLTDVIATGPAALPKKFSVGQNYPNPFNPATTIQYSLPERAKVTIDIYNILGQKVRRLIDETQPAGTHTIVWDGKNESDQAVSTGLYFYRVKAGDSVDSKKMMLLK